MDQAISNTVISKDAKVVIPAMIHPSFKLARTIQLGTQKNILFRTYGGIGDVICSEPTVRYAVENFKKYGNKFSVVTDYPIFFEHLGVELENIFHTSEKPDLDNYLIFDTITPPNDSNLVWLFFSHMLTHCVDFPSLCALRKQLPDDYKQIKSFFKKNLSPEIRDLLQSTGYNIVVHPGKHWQTKTFPKWWWDRVISQLLVKKSFEDKVILIGKDLGNEQGVVDVCREGCIDLIDKTTLEDTFSILQYYAHGLLTNDSSPLHMASTSEHCFIGFIATCKHQDYLYHWRNGQKGYRMQHYNLGGIWEHFDLCPNKDEQLDADKIDEETLLSWLPVPETFADAMLENIKRR